MFEEKHTAEAHGLLRTQDGTELASLADIVRWRMQSAEPLPMVEAARVVLDALQGLGDALALFQTDPARYAVALELAKRVITLGGKRFAGYRLSPGSFVTNWGQPRDARPVFEQTKTMSTVSRLEELRAAWVTRARGPADLARLPYVRWAIPRVLAVALFDFGPPRSFWDLNELQATGQPWQPTRPGTYPPAGLDGLPAHDADKWGRLLTMDQPYRGLVRLADLMRLQSDRLQLPAVPIVAAQVLAEVGAVDGLPLYVLQPGRLARLVADGELWRVACPSGAEHAAEWRRNLDAGICAMPNTLTVSEALARGFPVGRGAAFCGAVAVDPEVLESLPALAELSGRPGAIAWLVECWANRATGRDDLDTGPHAALAILADDAVALFGVAAPAELAAETEEAEEPAEPPAAPAPVLHLVDPQRPAVPPRALDKRSATERKAREAHALEHFKRAKEPDEVWQPEHFAELLCQVEYLTARGSGKLNADDAQSVIGELWGVSQNTVKTYVSKARKLRAESQLPACRA